MLFTRVHNLVLRSSLALCLLGAFACSPMIAAAQTQSTYSDAQLADVLFIDGDQGWAVGDRGTILHTTDGGAHWQLQSTGITTRLNCVYFTDDQHGWAAGGSTDPYVGTTRGTLLRTRDGGRHWIAESGLLIPTIRRIGFFDKSRGWCISQPSALFPSGVFTTDDGGRSWGELPASQGQSWLAADFVDPLTGVLVGRRSAIASVRRRGIEPVPNNEPALRALRAVQVRGKQGFAVGDGGLVLATQDRGRSWQTPSGELPNVLRQYFDLKAVCTSGTHVWAVGMPGTRVLHSPDAGATWTLQPTQHVLPLRAITFIDERHGWAAGDMGNILRTSDGGQSWHRQRSGGSRAAFLGVYSDAESLPLPLMARLSADEGYLSSFEFIARRDVADNRHTEADASLHEACVQTGACAADLAWQFPTRDHALRLDAHQTLETWNRVHDGRGVEALSRYLVTAIRQWQPSVVLTDAATADSKDAQAQLLSQLVLRCAEQAADPAFRAAELKAIGLAPWKVQKIYGTFTTDNARSSAVTPSQFAPRTGRTLGEMCAEARGILAMPSGASVAIGYRLLVDHVPQHGGREDIFSGIPLSPGGDARRRLADMPDQDLRTLQVQSRKRRNVEALVTRADENERIPGMALPNLMHAAQSLGGPSAAELLFQLGERYARTGRYELAADCFDAIAARFPKHPLAGPALTWLIQYYASSEIGWQLGKERRVLVSQATVSAPRSDHAQRAAFEQASPAIESAMPVSVKSAGGTFGASRTELERATKAAVYAQQLERAAPNVFALPLVRFPLAVAHRQQGYPRQAERFYMATRRARQHDAWWSCAQGEQWLARPDGESPKPVWICRKVTARPRLDGQLDDALWQQLAPVELKSPQHDDAQWPAAVMLARDDEFLYLGITCRKAPNVAYPAAPERRTRDADLTGDRFELLIDLDRDWTTYYTLALDHRGCTRDVCWRDQTWKPRWYVASAQTADIWTAEAAIPLDQLTAHNPDGPQYWAVGAQRIVPGVGFQSWTTPASPNVIPEGFGYVRSD